MLKLRVHSGAAFPTPAQPRSTPRKGSEIDEAIAMEMPNRIGTASMADMASRLTTPSNWWVMLRAVT